MEERAGGTPKRNPSVGDMMAKGNLHRSVVSHASRI